MAKQWWVAPNAPFNPSLMLPLRIPDVRAFSSAVPRCRARRFLVAACCIPTTKHTVVGCGLITLDYLATVDAYPGPDDKIRTTNLQIQGGGNAANALTSAARLGIWTKLISKVADDAHGNIVLSELRADEVDISNVIISEGQTTFTYIIIDKQTKTRTCIITAGPPMVPDDLPVLNLLPTLQDASLVYCDGYSHEMALAVAKQAHMMNIPILVDAEPERTMSELEGLLRIASFIVCSRMFPKKWTSAPCDSYALLSILLRYQTAKFAIVTLGEEGCMMLERSMLSEDTSKIGNDIESVYNSLKEKTDRATASPTCFSSQPMQFSAKGIGEISGRLHVVTAEAVPSVELVDTTGAGDAFIGAVLYGLCVQMPVEKMLRFACQVAAIKCRAVGARAGLPLLTASRLAEFRPKPH